MIDNLDSAQLTRRLRKSFAEKVNRCERDEWCRRAGIGKSTVEHYIYDGGVPSTRMLYKLCRALDVSADWLLGLEDE